MSVDLSPGVGLGAAADPLVYGGKAAGLARLVRAGLPVPPGLALPASAVADLAGGGSAQQLVAAVASLGPSLAVRSSAVGEDGAHASFAGQHRTELAVPVADVGAAVVRVAASAHSAAAIAYRRRMDVQGPVAMAAVVQEMVVPDTAGVLFTRNPLDGRPERVIEAAYGLGEAVVAGLVIPDRYHLAIGGALLDAQVGDKDVEVVPDPGGGTAQRAVDPARARARALDDAALAELERLAACCEAAFGGPCDVEWAMAGGRSWLLQARPVTV